MTSYLDTRLGNLSRTGPFVQSLGQFNTLAELIAGHPANNYLPGTMAYTVDAGQMISDGSQWLNLGTTIPGEVELKVATYAKARQVSGVTTGDILYVLGRTTQSDGGQGLFTWVAGGSTTINDGSQLSAPGGIWQRPDVTINAQWYGIDPTGVTASDVALNLAIQDAIKQKKKLIIPSGIFLLNAPLLCFVPGGQFAKVDIEGQGMALIGTIPFPPSPLSPYEPNTILCLNSKVVPAIIYQANRNCSLRNLSIQGINTNAFPSPNPPTDTPSDWILAGCATGLQSPYCAIAVDPFTSSVPADGGYAGLGAYYGPVPSGTGTSGLFLENVSMGEFVVGFALSCAGVFQGDSIRFHNVIFQFCDSAFACGDTQARNVNFFEGSITNVRQAFDTLNYGPSGGNIGANPIVIENVNFGNLFRVLALNNKSPVTVKGCYAENIRTLGQFGKSLSSACSINFMGNQWSITDNLWTAQPLFFESYGPTAFKRDLLGNSGGTRDVWNVTCGSAGAGLSCTLEQCRIVSSAYTDLPSHVGISYLGRAGARLRDCLMTSGVGTYVVTDVYPRSFGIGENANGKGRLRATYQSRSVTDGLQTYNYQPRSTTPYITANCTAASVVIGTTAYTITGITKAASAVVTVSTVSTINPFAVGQSVAFASVVGMVEINGLSGVATAIGGSSGAWTVTVSINSTAFTTYSSAGTATLNTLAFTESTLGEVQLNDILMWLMLPQGYSTNGWAVPAWKVTNIDGSGNCTAIPLWDISTYDTVVNSAGFFGANAVALVLHQWAPTTALTGNTHSNTTLDGLSQSALINGDWVQGVGIPTNTRVVSGGGTASVVLSKAATSTLTGINLYDGQLVASQQQGVYFPQQAGNTSTAPTPTFALGAVQAWTLSNNATWSAPSGAWVAGNRLTLLVTSTGAFTTAWNAVYRNAPAWAVAANGQKATAEFMYDGTNWQFIGGSAAFA